MNSTHAHPTTFTAVVLAADRGHDDPVARATHAACKSFVPVAGRPMVLRVLDALAGAREIEALTVCGPQKPLLSQAPELLARIESDEITWIPSKETPSTSAYHALSLIPGATRILITTSDHALLRPEIVDYFCQKARLTDYDVIVGLAPYRQVTDAYPETRRTATRLRDGEFCSCNLFAFLTPHARKAAEFWKKIESNRKKPWHMMTAVGWTVVLRYFFRRLSLDEGLDRLSKRMGLKAGAVILPFPEAAIDVDTVSDWQLVEKIVTGRYQK